MLDKQEVIRQALAFLQETPTGVLGTVSAADEPYTSTIYFAHADDFSIHFIVSHHSEKFKNLTLNPVASFTVGTGPGYEEVTVRGRVQQIDEPRTRESVLESIAKRVAAPMREWPIFKIGSLEGGGVALFRLTPQSVQYLNLGSSLDSEDPAKHIYQIIP
jgi:nitroimidazol reductase NimA-like FMN-containing flavoprotein (pyridoxamine 5'-phosphate oxidase superfamily)